MAFQSYDNSYKEHLYKPAEGMLRIINHVQPVQYRADRDLILRTRDIKQSTSPARTITPPPNHTEDIIPPAPPFIAPQEGTPPWRVGESITPTTPQSYQINVRAGKQTQNTQNTVPETPTTPLWEGQRLRNLVDQMLATTGPAPAEPIVTARQTEKNHEIQSRLRAVWARIDTIESLKRRNDTDLSAIMTLMEH